MKIISWNIARRTEPWRALLVGDADIALLQEAAAPPPDVSGRLETGPEEWRTDGPGRQRAWRTAVVNLTRGTKVEWIETAALTRSQPHQLGVSRMGTLTAARVTPNGIGETVTVVSLYGLWEKPHASIGGSWIYADASVHRLVSDLSGLIGQRTSHRLIVAGDLNILYGYGEHGDRYFAGRYANIFERLASLGLVFLGPQAPHGRRADPWPAELPADSKNVPTYFTTRQNPASATRQLDFVFASEALADRVTVTALIPTRIDQNPCAHSRRPIDLMRQGWSIRSFQASQQWATISS